MSEIKENWRSIKGYEGLYQVSDLGRVKGLKRRVRHSSGGYKTLKEKILKQTDDGKGYLAVHLSRLGKTKTYRTHVGVAIAFLGHVPCGHDIEVDHVNGNKLDCRACNLQLLTSIEHSAKTVSNYTYTSKYVGVCWNKGKNKWSASIGVHNKQIALGNYSVEEDARDAYLVALKKHKKGLTVRDEIIYSSRHTGVSFKSRHNHWESQISIKGKQRYLGIFNNEQDAYMAYIKAKENKHLYTNNAKEFRQMLLLI